METLSDVNASENVDPRSLNEIRNGDVSERIQTFEDRVEGSNLFEVFQTMHGQFGDLPAFKISELMKLDSLESASTRSLFSILSRILDESIDKKNGDISQRVASVLKLVVQEIEQRVSEQAVSMRKQSSLYKSRGDRYQSKIRALETLATGTTVENEVVMNHLQHTKIEKAKLEEAKKCEEQDLNRLRKEKDKCENHIITLKQELELTKRTHEEIRLQLEVQTEETKNQLEKKIMKLECLLNDSRKNVKELEDSSESKILQWNRKEQRYRHFIDSHFRSLQELRLASGSIKQEVLRTKNIYAEELHHFGINLKGLVESVQDYHYVLEENRKLYNEVQDLKGNIRVYCRIRPFLPQQSAKQTTIQYMGENGELVVTNPSKQGKDNHRLFKFNKIFGPAITQEEVFRDTQPLIRSVLDGYNVCIFAYGQTGSGKTYTMTGPNVTSVADWGVNYRALNDLFNISQNRKGSIAYEIGVQMVEIYNEQVRDLLCNDSSQKRYPSN
ncbi:P-loop nucleoside triphosphate hydrolase superfamily protein with CH (Calponin-like proteiny) domain [Forsythia ovata]|uniref:P-loop nucleoside triphosphate hydrolase superfamily protein with CH (Calponin-like proteiny) domain n=1 Tax=Forsythia ovata TaxID=205694 RepID=A0ABD1W1Z6_9LAMI